VDYTYFGDSVGELIKIVGICGVVLSEFDDGIFYSSDVFKSVDVVTDTGLLDMVDDNVRKFSGFILFPSRDDHSVARAVISIDVASIINIDPRSIRLCVFIDRIFPINVKVESDYSIDFSSGNPAIIIGEMYWTLERINELIDILV
jgi:hypothetical protein